MTLTPNPTNPPPPPLPAGWVWVTIDTIAQTTSGGTPSRKAPHYFDNGSIPWVKSGELRDTVISATEEFISQEGLENSSAKIFPAGTPLVALYGATVGRTGILGIEAATNQAVCAVFPVLNSFAPKFMTYWFQHQRQSLIDLSSGGAQPNISQQIIRSFPFPLAPLAEQRRIVEAIEVLFTQLEAGVTALKQARRKVRRYRASVLKAACEGRLVPQDPADEPAAVLLRRILAERKAMWKGKGKYQEPAGPDTAGLPYLPEGWVWVRVDHIGQVQLGRQRAPQHHAGNHMRPYLRVANVFEDYIDTSDVLEMNFTPREFEVYHLEYGDILLNEGQSLELVGRPAMYKDEVPGACFQNTLVRFRTSDAVLPQYALFVFRAYLHSGRFQRIATHTVNIAHLGAQRFAGLEFPLPPLAEQQRIVAEVERRLSVAAALEQSIDATLKRAERLRQSILKRAFSGQLVPQDPTDEPASALLARIRRERAGASPPSPSTPIRSTR